MKKQGKGGTASIPLSPPTGSSSVQVCHEYQKVAFKIHPENGHTTENSSHRRRERVGGRDETGKMTCVPDIISHSQEHRYMRDDSSNKNCSWTTDSCSQLYSGPEDNSTDQHETLTETSTLTFVDANTLDESAENQSLHGVSMVFLKEFVLIDDDDDGDMSLREKTVTDLSIMGGKAAELVCGRLLSTSSGSVSEYKEEPSAPEVPLPEPGDTEQERRPCCSCNIL